MPQGTDQDKGSFQLASGRILERFLDFFQNFKGDKADFERFLSQFRENVSEVAASELAIAAPAVETFVDGQIYAVRGLLEGMCKIAQNFGLWSPTPSYDTQRDFSKQSMGFPGQFISNILLSGRGFERFSEEDEALVSRFVTAMAEDIAVHDYCDTKPYTDHWGGMTDGEFEDLARRIVVDLNTLHIFEDPNGLSMGLTRAQRIEDIEDLLLKCKGTVYAMWKMSLYEECLKDPRGMQIRFIDNQKNNWQKKAEGRKRKLREAEIEDAATDTTRGKKRRISKKKAAELPLDELGMEYFDDPRGIPDKPPPKPAARRIPGAIKGSVVPRKMYRGPRFRAIQAIMASLGESQSAAPPPAFEPDAPAGGSSARDVARARAARLAGEALRVNQKGNVPEAEDLGTVPTGAADFDSSESGDDNPTREGRSDTPFDNSMAHTYAPGPEYHRDSVGQDNFASHVFQFTLPDVTVGQSQYGVPPSLAPAAYLDGHHAGGQGFATGENSHCLGMPLAGHKQPFTENDNGDAFEETGVYPQFPGDYLANGKNAKDQMSGWNIDPDLGGFAPLGQANTAASRRDSVEKVIPQGPWETIPFHGTLEPLEKQISGSRGAHDATEVIPESPPAAAYPGDGNYAGSSDFLFEALLYDGLPQNGQNIEDNHGSRSRKIGSSGSTPAVFAAPNGKVVEAINGANSGSVGDYARSPNFDEGLVSHHSHCDSLAPELVGDHKETESGPLSLSANTQSASIFDNEVDNKLLSDFNYFILNVSPEAQTKCKDGEEAQGETGKGSKKGGRSGSRV